VPAYTLNSVLGNVPVLGQLLVSRPGEGIFAFTYNISGTTSDPQVTVNPLSALAPGILRTIIGVLERGVELGPRGVLAGHAVVDEQFVDAVRVEFVDLAVVALAAGADPGVSDLGHSDHPEFVGDEQVERDARGEDQAADCPAEGAAQSAAAAGVRLRL